jgi:hypothetical protein
VRRRRVTQVVAIAAALVVSAGFVRSAGARPDAAAGKTLRFTALFLPGGRVVRHPPAGDAGDEAFVRLKLVNMPVRAGTGTVYTIASKDGKSTRYLFQFKWPDGTLGLIGRLTATPSGGLSQKFAVTSGSGVYTGVRGTGTLGKRPGGKPGLVVTIKLL